MNPLIYDGWDEVNFNELSRLAPEFMKSLLLHLVVTISRQSVRYHSDITGPFRK